MSVDYNNIAKNFSQSRKNMKWEEIGYFLDKLKSKQNISILDIGCGNGRFYGAILTSPLAPLLTGEGNIEYLGIDLSQGLLEEARKIYPCVDFAECNMLQLQDLFSSSGKGEVPEGGWGNIFFIASFHHLESLDDRLSVLKQTYYILEPGGQIYMTNWALDSELNFPKYSKNIVPDSRNKFGSQDYSIKFGDYSRYYHGFSLEELEYLFKHTGFEILENRLFDTGKNFISILKKPLD